MVVWLWQSVRPVLEELATTDDAVEVLLGALPRAKEPPPTVLDEGRFIADEVAEREFNAVFDVPPVHLWALWQRWMWVTGLKGMAEAPPYPGLNSRDASARQDGSRWTLESHILLVLFDPLYPSHAAPRFVDLIYDALRWLRREVGREKQPAGNGGARGRPPGHTETAWREVQRRLLELADQGEPYTNTRELAKRYHCALGTVSKAISDSPNLKGWRRLTGKSRRAPRAQSLNEVVTDSTEQTRESDPANTLTDEDVDNAMAHLIQETVDDEERARLNSLDDQKRRETARLYRQQQRDDPDVGRPDGRDDTLRGRKP